MKERCKSPNGQKAERFSLPGHMPRCQWMGVVFCVWMEDASTEDERDRAVKLHGSSKTMVGLLFCVEIPGSVFLTTVVSHGGN